jgi:hypothetical protein
MVCTARNTAKPAPAPYWLASPLFRRPTNFIKNILAAHRKSVNPWDYSSIANPQVSWVCQPPNRNSAIFKKINPQIC